MADLTTARLLGVVLALAACGPEGDPGPIGPAGPPGPTVNGVSRVAHFDRVAQLDTWEYTASARWRIAEGRLWLRSADTGRAQIGPGATFDRDLSAAVEIDPGAGDGAVAFGLITHASEEGGYMLRADRQTLEVSRIDAAGSEETSIIAATPYNAGAPVTLALLVRGEVLSVYVNDALTARGRDAVLSGGKVRLFVEGTQEVAFDEMWVNSALPLE